MDPRLSIIDERLKEVKRIIAISSGKGGVGKSLIASTLALLLARKGFKVGLLDLDFTSPSTHVILGVVNIYPKEDRGIIPAEVYGIRYISIVAYSREETLPLRGADLSNALIELFAVTRWGDIDFLVIDMPPGISDATLDILRLVKKIEFLIVTTSSVLAFETVKKLVRLLFELRVPILGIIENMKLKEESTISQLTADLGLRFLGNIPFEINIENAFGDVDALLRTGFAKKLDEVISGCGLFNIQKS